MMLKEGDKYETAFSISQEQVIKFAEVSGDSNPLHLDNAFAATTIFKKPIIHGFLGGSIFSKVLGTEFPGKGTVYLKQNMDFLRPMYAGEQYTASFEIKSIMGNEGKGLIETTVKDSRGKVAIKGEALVLNKEVFSEEGR